MQGPLVRLKVQDAKGSQVQIVQGTFVSIIIARVAQDL